MSQFCIFWYMPPCRHQKLVLLEKQGKKLRFRHCHLTIDEEELHDSFFPECQEVYCVRRRDFEEIEPKDDGKAQYRCEDCGAVIEVG